MDNNTLALEEANFERLIRIIIPTIFGFIVAIGLVGNVLVILVVLLDQQMRSTTNILIVSLALADLLFIVFCVPFTASHYALPIYPFGSAWCKFEQYMMYVCAFASVYTLVLMSFDRYLAVVHAIRSMTLRNEKNTYIVVFIMWLIILLSNIPLIFEHTAAEYDYNGQNKTACINFKVQADLNTTRYSGRIFYGFFFGFSFLIPLVIVIILYGFMLKRLLYGGVPGGGNQSAESLRAKKRVTRMVIVVVAIFAICWLPIQVIFLILNFGNPPASTWFLGVQMAANCLAYMNSCMNPILYAFLSDNFRKSFRKLLCCFTKTSLSKNDYERTNYRGIECAESRTTAVQSYNHVYAP